MPLLLCPRSFALLSSLFALTAAAGGSIRESGPLKELIELMADRMELAEPVAKFKWERRVAPEDDKTDPAANVTIFKQTTFNPKFMDSFCQAQLAAFKERQRQLFIRWKAAGTEGFDEVEDVIAAARTDLEKNAHDEVSKIVLLKGSFCPPITMNELNDIAAPILKKHSIDRASFKPMLESLEMLAREDSSGCRVSKER